MKLTLLTGFIALAAGCGTAYAPAPLSSGHPAHPEATQAAYTSPARLADVAHDPEVQAAAQQAVETQDGLPDDAQVQLKTLLDAYLAAGDLLAEDETTGLAPHGAGMAAAVEALSRTEVPADPHLWHRLVEDLDAVRSEAQALTGAADLTAARAGFGRLSDALVRVLETTGAPDGYDAPVTRFTCGMYAEVPHGGVWLQLGNAPRNPYFGTKMLTCQRDQTPLPGGVDEAEPADAPHHQHGGQG